MGSGRKEGGGGREVESGESRGERDKIEREGERIWRCGTEGAGREGGARETDKEEKPSCALRVYDMRRS